MTKKEHCNAPDNECIFKEVSGDWGHVTGDFIISDGEEVVLAHHATDEDGDECTMVKKDGVLRDV